MKRSVCASIFALWVLPAVLLTSACQSAPPATNVRLPSIFSDHMVVQRALPVQVWGWADPGGELAVRLGDETVVVPVADDSSWSAQLPSMAAGGPYELTLIGADTTRFSNVMVGEVWIVSGQSNMEWDLRRTNDAEAEIAAAKYPDIRLFTVAHDVAAEPKTDVISDGWAETTPETIPGFSAVAYFFGRKLHEELDVPIGLVSTNWGGTPAEAWTSKDALRSLDDFREAVESIDAELEARGAGGYQEALAAWTEQTKTRDTGYADDGTTWADADFDASGWETMNVPAPWESAGLPGYDGVVWFRKSFNLTPAQAGQTLTLSLGPIDDRDSTWVNGVRVGHTDQYNTPRTYTVPASVTRPGANVLAVRVLDTGGGGGIYGEPDLLTLETAEGAPVASLAGAWQYRPGMDMADAPRLPPSPQPQHLPSALYNAMIAPLIPYGIRGAIWYQGESNAGRAYQYRELFPALITDWRTQWGQGDFPFLFVQLANFMEAQTDPNEQSAWPELREAQAMALDLPNTGMATIIDIGEADDIHPRNKQDVGLRLALNALATVYDRDELVYSGPAYRSMEITGNEIRVTFDHVGGGLEARGGTLKGFAVAGPDSQFVWADAEIDGEAVVVSHPNIQDPIAVRYGWANNPDVTLYNAEGLPAVPFRTDGWPGVTEASR